ncbi:hypothetical protein [Mesorhizobium caraganae]|uniref:hypothetical protein n=1 Tax=Mesorhizobium caraganae TaxID=483206 RepID=UPI0017838BCB|nr:hypothetical protein [Mesorhizobium caraganae]
MDGARFLRGRPTGKPNGLRIVDADIHLYDPPQALAPYCEMRWRKSLEIAGQGRHGYVDIPGYAVGGMQNVPPIPGGHEDLSVLNKNAMREELDLLGVDDGILLPDNLLNFVALLITTPLVVLLFSFFTQSMNQFNKSKSEMAFPQSISIVLPPR